MKQKIETNYIVDMAKYSSNTDSVIRACFNLIEAQLAKDNRRFQYKVVQKGGSSALFGASIEWLNLAGIVLKCQKIAQANDPIAVNEVILPYVRFPLAWLTRCINEQETYASNITLVCFAGKLDHET